MDSKYEKLKLENQLCFPLYACSKEIVKQYKPFLDQFNLTYTQYITMMVLWEQKEINVKELGKYLYLDSGTLTPLLKKLEQKRWITRSRDTLDERVLLVRLTKEGQALREELVDIPNQIGRCLNLDSEEIRVLYKGLYKILDGLEQKQEKSHSSE